MRLAELQNDVNVFSIFEEMLKANDVGVVERSMNLDFTHELLLGPRLRQRSLVDNFGSRNSFCLLVSEFVTFGETTFTEEFSSDVSFDTDIAVKPNDFLLNHGLGAIVRVLFSLSLLLAHQNF